MEESKYIINVNFDNSFKSYTFFTTCSDIVENDYVIVETTRGLEMAKVVSKAQIYHGDATHKYICRIATHEDKIISQNNKKDAKEAMKICESIIQDLQLEMNLLTCEYVHDRTKVIFTYIAEERVDFRELLKNLSYILKTRIELRQIGSRDRSKLLGGCGICGRILCCNKGYSEFEGISISMAKNQLLSLNTQKLAGQCGKLRCCLKFEDNLYSSLKETMPKINDKVTYKNKLYNVVQINPIANKLRIEREDESIIVDQKDIK